MKKVNILNVINTIFAFIIIITLTYGLVKLFLAIARRIIASKSDIIVSTIIVLVTALIGFIGIIIQRYFDKIRDIRQNQRNKKAEIYEAFINMVFDFLASKNKKHKGLKDLRFEDCRFSLIF